MSRSTGIETVDLATRWPLYLFSASEPLVVLLLVLGQPQVELPSAGVLLALSVLHTVSCIVLLRAGLAHYLGGRRPATSLIIVPVVLTLVGVLASAAAQHGLTADGGLRLAVPDAAAALIFCTALTGALVPLLRSSWLFGLVAAGTLAAGGLEFLVGAPGRQVWAVNYFLVAGAVAGTYRFSVWFLGLAWENDRARDVEARLAVAEERLRFARDLHDVLGRNLALIAVNSQLAAELVRRGQDGAVERMLDVHRTAQDSMREVREVVAGSRRADLDAELAGARSVLRSAGITVRVIGDGALLPAAAQAALGWVVREATTNIIRHSDPSTVRIDLEVRPDRDGAPVVVLRIENDGARSAAEGGSGTGLVGLRERLAALGGDLDVNTETEGRFVVGARLPLDAGTVSTVTAERTPG